eukprot:2494016-Heterocapsa_arctica.AAC.1
MVIARMPEDRSKTFEHLEKTARPYTPNDPAYYVSTETEGRSAPRSESRSTAADWAAVHARLPEPPFVD